MAKGSNRPQIGQAQFTGQLSGVNALLNAIREQIQIDQGDRGDPLDRAVKIRDLAEAGVADFVLSKRGKGQYANLKTPDASTVVLSSPPNPYDLKAYPTTATVYLTWGLPNYSYHAYTEIWRSSEDNLSTAVDLGARPSYRYYSDPVDSGETYYYWIRFVTYAGKKSDFNAVDGTKATTVLSASTVLEALNEKITSNQLVSSLRSDIEKIPTLSSGLENEALNREKALADEASERANAIANEAEERASAIQQEVEKRENALNTEAQARILGDRNEIQNRNEAIAAEKQDRIDHIKQSASEIGESILAESQERIRDFEALKSITVMKDNGVRELELSNQISNETKSRIQQYEELSASHQTLIGRTDAEIQRLDDAVASEGIARASSIENVTAKLEGKLGEAREAAVNEAINTITTDDDVIAQVISKISAADTTGWATINYVDQSVITPLNALTERTQSLESQYQSIDSTYLSKSTFTDWSKAYDSDKEATAERLNSLDTAVGDNKTELSSKAGVSQLAQAKSDIYNSSVSQFGSIDAQFRKQEGDISARATKTEVSDIAASLEEASVKQTDKVITSLNQSSFETQAQALKTIEQSVSADQSQFNRLDDMRSEYRTGLSVANAAISESQKTIADSTSALVEVINTNKSQYENDKAKTLATKTELEQSISDQDQARSTLSKAIDAQFESQQDDIDTRATKTELTEAVSTEAEARTTLSDSIATQFSNQQEDIDTRATQEDLIKSSASSEAAYQSIANKTTTSLNNLKIETEAQTLKSINQSVNSDRSQIEKVDSLRSEFKTGLSSTNASIVKSQKVFSDSISSLVETINTQKSEYEDDKKSVLASKNELSRMSSSQDQARVTLSESVNAQFESQQDDIDTRATKTELSEAVSNAEEARTTLSDSIATQLSNQQDDIDTRATKTELSEAVSTESSARVKDINKLSTTVDGHTATLQTQSESIDGLKTNWAVKFQLDSNGVSRVSGFGLNADGESTGAHFDVDQFSISKPGAEALDFAVSDVKQPDGSTKRMVVMDAAKLVNLQVDNAMIKSLSADKITSGKINAERIDTANLSVDWANIKNVNIDGANIKSASIQGSQIKDASITSAKIGSKIQSDDFIHGRKGWRILKSGEAEFNGPVISRELQVASGEYSIGNVDCRNSSGIILAHEEIIDTGKPVPPWSGTKHYTVSNCGFRVTKGVFVYRDKIPSALWGVTSEVLPMTRWNAAVGGPTIHIVVRIYTRRVRSIGGCYITWKLLRVT